MKNMLLSAAIGDIAGMPYEFEGRTKNYDAVDLLLPSNTYTDDTVCTFACAEALMKNLDMAENLWKRCRADLYRGFGGRFARWLMAKEVQPSYHSFGNGSGMRVSAAGFMARSVEECVDLATKTALPTHDHPEGIKGAVATALAIYYGMAGKSKKFIRRHVLSDYYPDWAGRTYDEIKPDYYFDETCQLTIPAALICFLESTDYADCLKKSIALGGDADTLAAIAGPMAYAFYKEMPEELIANAKAKLPEWMLQVNEDFDQYVSNPDVPQELLTMMHGQVRTLIDLLKALNKEKPITDSDDAMTRLSELVERNVRYGDEFAFIAMRTIWCLMARYTEQNKRVDIDQLEKDMMSFHDRFYGPNEDISAILYGYSVRKIVKYIQLVNEFRRYTSYEQIREDLQSLLPFSHCSENEPDYYFSFNRGTLSEIDHMLRREWQNVTSRGVLSNKKLESVAFGRFENMVREHGIKETIRLAYTDVGCHSDIQGPMPRKEGTAWGPVYRLRGSRIEKGCSDFRRWPFTGTSFEMRFVKKLLDKDEAYMHVGDYYVPVSDYTLPVFSEYTGRISFESEEDKRERIEIYKSRR